MTFEEEVLHLARVFRGICAGKTKQCAAGLMSPKSLRECIARAETKFMDAVFELRKKYSGK